MLIHVSGVPDFVEALAQPVAALGLRSTPHPRRAGLVVRSHNGSPGPWVTPHDLDDQPCLDVVFGEIDGVPMARIGPLSVPGLTACPGCVAAHEREPGPLRPLGSVAHPDPGLVWIAAGVAARELAAGVACLTSATAPLPLTWSAVLLVPRLGTPVDLPVLRHVHCGCTWADFMLG